VAREWHGRRATTRVAPGGVGSQLARRGRPVPRGPLHSWQEPKELPAGRAPGAQPIQPLSSPSHRLPRCLSSSFVVSLSRPVPPYLIGSMDGLMSKSVNIRPRRSSVQVLAAQASLLSQAVCCCSGGLTLASSECCAGGLSATKAQATKRLKSKNGTRRTISFAADKNHPIRIRATAMLTTG
jgi:hypothetical protein